MKRDGSSEKRSFALKFVVFGAILVLLPFLVPILLIALVLHLLNKIVVYLLVWLWWLPNSKDILLVSSDSPVWRDYMEKEILPLVSERAILLNWSECSKWRKLSLSVRVFRAFRGRRDFNPMIVLFRPLRPAKVFRFLPAFKDWKHGHTEKLERLRHNLTLAL